MQRDALLCFAAEGIYRPTWSSAILEELEYHEAKKLVQRGEERVVVIGIGATAVTLAPAMADRGRAHDGVAADAELHHAGAEEDAVDNLMRRVLGEKRGHAATRRKNIAQQRAIWRFCKRFPNAARKVDPQHERQAAVRGLPSR